MSNFVRRVSELPAKVIEGYEGAIRFRNVLRPNLGGSENLSINAVEMPSGSGTPLHIHRRSEEAWVVTAGKGAIRIEDDWFSFQAGDVLTCPADVQHQVVALGDEVLRYYAVTSPAVDLETDNEVFAQFDETVLDSARAAVS